MSYTGSEHSKGIRLNAIIIWDQSILKGPELLTRDQNFLSGPKHLTRDQNILFSFSFLLFLITFLFLCWFGSLNVKSKNVLNKVVNVCGKVVGERQEHLSQLYERREVRKARVIVDDN